MKNVLITGGSGFIGSNLTLEIQSRHPKAQITVVDDFRGSSFKNLLGFRGDVLAMSIADKNCFSALLKRRRFDHIFHLASITDTTVLDEQKMMFDNVEGFRNILELAVKMKSSVVYASSAAVYGSQESSMKEADGGTPNNIYGFSKWTLENLARLYNTKLQIIGLRFFNVFGPREEYKGKAASMIYQLYLQMKAGKRPRIFKYGEQKRDFIYVKDVVEAILLAPSAKANTVINVGTGRSTTFNGVIGALNEALGTQLETEYFDNPYDFYQDFTQADMKHAEAMTGFKTRYTTREAILDYVRNYLEAGKKKSASQSSKV